MNKDEQTSQIGAQQVSGSSGQENVPLRSSDGGARANSSIDGNQPFRVSGEDWERGNFLIPPGIAGKIVDELIANTEKRASEAQECIEWYEREHSYARQRLEELRELRRQIDELTKEAE